ncbi:hypothetical protein CSC00_5868 (plasmid) [Klebsiella pneumoniae]|uniref:Uncharacterized protein n=1 Tax=Klebsiella pneumoniae TaxID=573 RepID=A0A220SUR5_KLEPN|nr:hypothetical protein [Klebsiella pneumoniae]AVJ88990.1 hypothetical protein CSC00_5868 [Klebsiella pneumoniae]
MGDFCVDNIERGIGRIPEPLHFDSSFTSHQASTMATR